MKLLIKFSFLLLLFSCEAPTVKESVNSCVTSKQFQIAKCGERLLDYTKDKSQVGEWVDPKKTEIKPISEVSDQVCFSIEDYLLKIKPTLKEGHDFWKDHKKTKQKNIVDNETLTEKDL